MCNFNPPGVKIGLISLDSRPSASHTTWFIILICSASASESEIGSLWNTIAERKTILKGSEFGWSDFCTELLIRFQEKSLVCFKNIVCLTCCKNCKAFFFNRLPQVSRVSFSYVRLNQLYSSTAFLHTLLGFSRRKHLVESGLTGLHVSLRISLKLIRFI